MMVARWFCCWPSVAIYVIAGWTGALAEWPAEWRPAQYPVPVGAVYASQAGVNPDPVNGAARMDVAPAFQKALTALAPGQTLYLSPGKYHVSVPLFIPSGVSLQGAQDEDGHPLATIVQTAAFGTWAAGRLKLGVLMNSNYAAPNVVDRDINITSIAFNHQSSGIMFRMASNVRIQGSSFNGGGDAAGFLASQHVVVTASLATNTSNAAYDFWDGVSDVQVEDSIAHLAGGYGISFNAVDTDGTARTSRDLVAVNNVITGAGKDAPAIYVDPLGQHNSRIEGEITIANNRIFSPQRDVQTGGIFVSSGDADIVTINGNYIAGSKQYPPILVTGYRQSEGYTTPGSPLKTIISMNTVEDNVVASANGALIPAEGRDVQVSQNLVRRNRFDYGGPPPFIKSSGIVHAWDNELAGTAGSTKAYNVPPLNLSLQPPRQEPP